MAEKGKIIVMEGTDGSGKTEQFKKLIARFKENDIDVRTFDFPRYGKPSAYFVERYLRGDYGSREEIGPHKASLFYAMDRFDVSEFLNRVITEGKIAVMNRYVGSNMGHQGSKIPDREERRKFFQWLDEIEHEILGIPRPDINIVLRVPAEVAQKMVDNKGRRTYIGGARRDIHEADLEHLKQAERAYLELTEEFPENFHLIECFEDGQLLSIEQIHERVWETVKTFLE